MHFKIHDLVLALVLCLTTAACSLPPNYGRITPNEDVGRSIEGYEVHPEFRYYVSGPLVNPNALMGLKRPYRLDPATLWREVVDMTPAQMKEIVDGMYTKVYGRTTLQGFELLDPSGRPIGIWYSILKAPTFLRMNDDGTVRIDTPPLETYESDRDKPQRNRMQPPRSY